MSTPGSITPILTASALASSSASSQNVGKMLNIMEQYFVPPTNLGLMQWGQTAMVVAFLLIMMGSILYIYVNVNLTQYQDRISVISSAYLFGSTPQDKFKQFVKNSQAESIATVMNNIQSTADRANIANSRLNNQAGVLAKQVSVDLPNSAAQTNNLGISIQKNIAQVRDTVSKLGGALMLNNYMTNGAVKTTQPAAASPGPASATSSS